MLGSMFTQVEGMRARLDSLGCLTSADMFPRTYHIECMAAKMREG
jgi:hypothetical protein